MCPVINLPPPYRDPDTNQVLNFNYLPYYAVKEVGVLPHTVQVYSLDDPAPTYGQKNFKDMWRYMSLEAGRRSVLWFPESAYWVTYDIDVPLFLPLYAERRFHDLRLIAAAQKGGKLGRDKLKGSSIDGQLLFSSGFEWGYWLNDVVSARAVWNPRTQLSEKQAFKQYLNELLTPTGLAREALVELLIDTIQIQHDLMVSGIVSNQSPQRIEKHNGFAYLSGVDTWDQLSSFIRSLPMGGGFQTQPDQYSFFEVLEDKKVAQKYNQSIKPLLKSMADKFQALSKRCKRMKRIPSRAIDIFQELCDGLEINALRAQFIDALYQSAYASHREQEPRALEQLQRAQYTILKAEQVVKRREASYRVSKKYIADWRPTPTAYNYGYLWTVSTLHLWKRDFEQLKMKNKNACYKNNIDPMVIAFGEIENNPLVGFVRTLGYLLPFWQFNECIHVKKPEYK